MNSDRDIVEGLFDAGKLLFDDRMIEKQIIWRYKGEETEIHDRGHLKERQQKYLREKDYAAVKQINDILLELNYSEKREYLDSYPLNLQIEHTNFCNARCIMCSHCFTKNHGASNLSEDNLCYLKEILPYVHRITLHGYGEPFMHPDIVKILRMYDSYGIKMTCNTNASIMNPELAELIHKCFYDISISCDGATAYTYEHIRQGLNFETFKKNVRLLRSHGERLFMRMAVVIMRQNLEELPDIVRLAAELGFQEVLFVDVTTQGLLENEKDSLIEYPAAAKHFIDCAKSIGEKLKLSVKVPEYIMNLESEEAWEKDVRRIHAFPLFKGEEFTEQLYKRYKESGFIETTMPATKENFLIPGEYSCEGICDFVMERPYINAKGDVFLCCTNWMHVVGNVYRDGGFEAVWNGEIMRGIRRMFYNGEFPKYCTGCIFVRDDMMCRRLKVNNLSGAFYKHNYDELVMQMISEAEAIGRAEK